MGPGHRGACLGPKSESGRMAQSLRPSRGQRAQRLPAFLHLRPAKLCSSTHETRLEFKNVARRTGRKTRPDAVLQTEVAQSWVCIGPVTHTGCALFSGKCSYHRCRPWLGSVLQTSRKIPPDPGGWLGSSFPRLRVTGGVHAS